MSTKPTLYRYRDEHGHFVTLPYAPNKLPERMKGKITHLPDHAAVSINGNALPVKPRTPLGKKAPARIVKTSPATKTGDRPQKAEAQSTEATEEATK